MVVVVFDVGFDCGVVEGVGWFVGVVVVFDEIEYCCGYCCVIWF